MAAEYDRLSFEQVSALVQHRTGKTDIPCPLCSAGRSTAEKKKRKVFRVYRDSDNFLRFHCIHCGEKGWLRAGNAIPVDIARLTELRREAAKRDQEERLRRIGKARAQSRDRLPIKGTIAETYLKSRGIDNVPETLGYQPPHHPYPFPAMVGLAGIPDEPEPGVYRLPAERVTGVHLTFLQHDGSSKAPIDPQKKMIGRILGSPLALIPPGDGLGLLIAEGIETALSGAQELGLGTWAAGGAPFLPALSDAVPRWIEYVTIAREKDAAGQRGADELARRLEARKTEVIMIEVD